jgi:hypothetical protein
MKGQAVEVLPIISRGVKIGGGVDAKRGEWRCKICKFKNFYTTEEGEAVNKCNMCREPK